MTAVLGKFDGMLINNRYGSCSIYHFHHHLKSRLFSFSFMQWLVGISPNLVISESHRNRFFLHAILFFDDFVR